MNLSVFFVLALIKKAVKTEIIDINAYFSVFADRNNLHLERKYGYHIIFCL